MFLGTFTPKLLPNNQVALPSKLREELNGGKVVLTKGFDKCVYGFSVIDWKRIVSEELLKPLLSEEGRKIRQRIFSVSEEVSCDPQGRVVVSEYLRSYADLSNEIVIIGAGDHFEIWNKIIWEEYNKNL